MNNATMQRKQLLKMFCGQSAPLADTYEVRQVRFIVGKLKKAGLGVWTVRRAVEGGHMVHRLEGNRMADIRESDGYRLEVLRDMGKREEIPHYYNVGDWRRVARWLKAQSEGSYSIDAVPGGYVIKRK